MVHLPANAMPQHVDIETDKAQVGQQLCASIQEFSLSDQGIRCSER